MDPAAARPDAPSGSGLPDPRTRPRIGVPARLLAARARPDGGAAGLRLLTEALDRHLDRVPIRPEAEIGLGTSRAGAQGEGDAAGSRDAGERDGRRRAVLGRLDGCVVVDGGGAFASRLAELRPDLPVEEAGRLTDDTLREHFVERVFARARLRALFEGVPEDTRSAADTGRGGGAADADEDADGGAWRPRDLVAFHARHKLQLMAHSPEGYRAAGRVAARAGDRPRAEVERDYTAAFTRALERPTTPGTHANALQHAFGMVSGLLDDTARREVLDAVERYRRGDLPLGVPAALIRRLCAAEGVEWAARQTYLAPFPADALPRTALAGRSG
ncbi:YbgA family protein [Streptomonospora sp. S1-112]|uniref:YbgA family protein n=1 Tax=Streptomonospora mangrovi TaxID=2883123 RepID=A0A9X3NXT2_9ACTN|nr:DUF1722 domain-containing protein [Streptomonospora mangrovi]MDA0566331.1 YbgA family protein [Streptomonospora mangrovi]